MLERCARRLKVRRDDEESDDDDDDGEGPRPPTDFGPGIPSAGDLGETRTIGSFNLVSHDDGEELPGELREGEFLP